MCVYIYTYIYYIYIHTRTSVYVDTKPKRWTYAQIDASIDGQADRSVNPQTDGQSDPWALLPKFRAATVFLRLPLYLYYATPKLLPCYPNSGLPFYFNDCHFIWAMPPPIFCLITQIQRRCFISTTATLFELCHPWCVALLPNSGLSLYFNNSHFIRIMPPLLFCLIAQIQGGHFISTTATSFELCHPWVVALLPKFRAATLFQRLSLDLNYATPDFLPYYPNSGLPLYFNDCHFIGTMPPLILCLITQMQGCHFISTTAALFGLCHPWFVALLTKSRTVTLFQRLPPYLNYATPELLPYYPNPRLPLYFNDCHFVWTMPPLICCRITQIQGCHFISTTATLFELCHPWTVALLPKNQGCHFISTTAILTELCHPWFVALLPKFRAATLFQRLPLYLKYATP